MRSAGGLSQPFQPIQQQPRNLLRALLLCPVAAAFQHVAFHIGREVAHHCDRVGDLAEQRARRVARAADVQGRLFEFLALHRG